MRYKLLNYFVFSSCCQLVIGQTGELRSVEEVIRGIDELLGEYDQGFEPMDTGPKLIPLFFPKVQLLLRCNPVNPHLRVSLIP